MLPPDYHSSLNHAGEITAGSVKPLSLTRTSDLNSFLPLTSLPLYTHSSQARVEAERAAEAAANAEAKAQEEGGLYALSIKQLKVVASPSSSLFCVSIRMVYFVNFPLLVDLTGYTYLLASIQMHSCEHARTRVLQL